MLLLGFVLVALAVVLGIAVMVWSLCRISAKSEWRR